MNAVIKDGIDKMCRKRWTAKDGMETASCELRYHTKFLQTENGLGNVRHGSDQQDLQSATFAKILEISIS